MTGRRGLVVATEAGLAAITMATVLGMSRLFDGGGWLGPLAVNAAVAHLVVTGARRRGLSLASAAVVTILGAALVATWTSYGATTSFGIPTSNTWSAMQDDLGRAWTLYQDVVAPAPVEPGFVLASSLALWFIAFIADWAAFRLWVPFEATLPAGTLFLFTALLGAPRGRGWAVGLFASSVLTFLLLHRLTRQDGSSHWVAERRAQGHRSLLTVGVGLGAVAVVTGVVFGPSLPGADSAGVVDPRALHDGDSSRVTISPLVDIRARLVDQARTEVFTVRSSQPSYWRLTSLERFDGQIWSSSGSYSEADGTLPEHLDAPVAVETFDQTFEITALAAIWLPGAYQPRAIDVADEAVAVLYEEDSATLIVDQDADTSDGLDYTVTSSSPRITAADLSGSSGPIPEEIADRFLGLPDDFSPEVRSLARDLTEAAATPYAAARALQDHLRTFTYDLGVQSGHGGDVLERFLFETKRGYCEQFAGAFAAMARSIGLPARVAVGFTTGEADVADPTLYHVRGEHAHAWPEVFLAGAGWVSFEPTPGRGMPFAEDYTGVPVAQASTDDPATATTAPPTTQPATIPTLPDGSQRPFRDDELNTNAGRDSDAEGDRDASVPTRFVLQPIRRAAPTVGALVVAYLVLVPLALLLHRWRRRRLARTPAARIELAWTECAEEAELLGYRGLRSDTFAERAERLAAHVPGDEVAASARQLARQMEASTYSAPGADELAAELAEEAAAVLVRTTRAATSRTAQVRRWVDLPAWVRRTRRDRSRPVRITGTVTADLEAQRELAASTDRHGG